MSGRLRHFLFTSVILGILFLLPARGSLAQGNFSVRLSSLDASAFPHLTLYLDVHDPAGGFVHELTQADITLQENGTQVPVSELVEKKTGVQFAMAIASGSTFTNRDGSGISRYEYLLQGMLSGTWASQTADQDDFSLLTVGGPQLTHISDPSSLRKALESYQPADTDDTPNLELLASAVQVVSDPTPRPGMERAILFITPPQSSEVALGLQSIASSAIQENIHIFVWLLAPEESFSLPEIDLLRGLASQTQASFFGFSQAEIVPDIEAMLEPLRYVYQLGYDSQAKTAGAQQVVAQVNLGGEQVSSAPQVFELNLQPPVVELMDPPTEIERSFATQPIAGIANAVNNMQPAEQQLDIQVTFPDGYERELTRTSLYVDGSVVAENTSPPFERFAWDLRSYVQDGTHIIKVEVVDKLGWAGQTSEIPVKITVPSNTQEIVAVVSQKRYLLIGITVFISASLLLLLLIIGGRIRPKPYPGQVRNSISRGMKRLAGSRQSNARSAGALNQPARMGSSNPGQTRITIRGWLALFPWFQPKPQPVPALAYLVPLSGSDEPTLPARLALTAELASLGSDPHKADLVIADPSIEGLHATLHQAGGSYQISDAGSVAGTWVNYVQVPDAGVILSHADIIHMGRVGFRYELADPGTPVEITITPVEPGL